MSSADSNRLSVHERLAAGLAGQYAVRGQVGRGSMATVFVADDLRTGGRVAIKVLDPRLVASLTVERFHREIAILQRLSHPRIVPLLASGEVGEGLGRLGLCYYIMPFEGETLGSRLAEVGPLPLEEVRRLAADLGEAIDYAHREGIVHRDVKPDNVLLREGRGLLCDFGIARAVVAAGGERISSSGVVIGTAGYLSPEQAAGRNDIDGRVDVYGMGCVLYEMLTGEMPFTGPSVHAVILKHLTAVAPPIRTVRPDVPAYVEAAVMRALSKNRDDRPASAGALAAALQ